MIVAIWAAFLIYLTKIPSRGAAKVFFGCFVATRTLRNGLNLREIKTVPQVDKYAHKPASVGRKAREYF